MRPIAEVGALVTSNSNLILQQDREHARYMIDRSAHMHTTYCWGIGWVCTGPGGPGAGLRRNE